jgi:hypothetical protein
MFPDVPLPNMKKCPDAAFILDGLENMQKICDVC